MNFEAAELLKLVQTIWETMLQLEIAPETGACFGNRPRSMGASIHITGAWNGAILLECPVEVAQVAAGRMFGKDPEQTTLTDQQDVLAELVNVLGGNFKALLPETCHLSLPAVVEGGDFSARVPGSTVAARAPFVCAGRGASITVLERTEGAGMTGEWRAAGGCAAASSLN